MRNSTTVKLSHVIDELVEERGIDRETLSTVVAEGILAAYKKKYPDLENLSAHFDRKSGDVAIVIKKTVAATVENDDAQITLRKARAVNENAEVGQEIDIPFDGSIGRIEILKAKQIIAQKIRSIEADIVFREFSPKLGTIVTGVVHKLDRNGVIVKIKDTLAFLPKSLTLPEDRYIVGYTIRAHLKEVYAEPRNENQLILDRASIDFVSKLFELEIPEVFEGLVKIEKIVREPGYKTKMVVSSRDSNIDPVGTCVGIGGARIKPILRELGSEKIDVLPAYNAIDDLLKASLKPAVVNRVEIDREGARVWVDDDQRSLAIGRMGKNISLASQLIGMHIELVGGGERAALDQEVASLFKDNDDAEDAPNESV